MVAGVDEGVLLVSSGILLVWGDNFLLLVHVDQRGLLNIVFLLNRQAVKQSNFTSAEGESIQNSRIVVGSYEPELFLRGVGREGGAEVGLLQRGADEAPPAAP